jgi:hypothetical protein
MVGGQNLGAELSMGYLLIAICYLAFLIPASGLSLSYEAIGHRRRRFYRLPSR